MGNCCGSLTKNDSCANHLDTSCYKMTEFMDMKKAGAIIYVDFNKAPKPFPHQPCSQAGCEVCAPRRVNMDWVFWLRWDGLWVILSCRISSWDPTGAALGLVTYLSVTWKGDQVHPVRFAGGTNLGQQTGPCVWGQAFCTVLGWGGQWGPSGDWGTRDKGQPCPRQGEGF